MEVLCYQSTCRSHALLSLTATPCEGTGTVLTRARTMWSWTAENGRVLASLQLAAKAYQPPAARSHQPTTLPTNARSTEGVGLMNSLALLERMPIPTLETTHPQALGGSPEP